VRSQQLNRYRGRGTAFYACDPRRCKPTEGGFLPSIWMVLGLALLPALGNFAGGLLAECFHVSRRQLNRALHAAAGVVLAVVAVELMPEALARIPAWAVALSFGLGGVAYVLIEALVDRLQGGEDTQGSGSKSMWMIFIAVSMDLFSDGLMIGAGSSVSLGMAITLACGQVMADIPEGYATIANMKANGVSRMRRLLLSASFAVPVVVAAVAAYYLLRGQGDLYQLGALAFTAGLLTVAAVEDMMAEAHDSADDGRTSVLAFVGGFVLFILVSAGLGN
jgi:ZIP family zinc transporter